MRTSLGEKDFSGKLKKEGAEDEGARSKYLDTENTEKSKSYTLGKGKGDSSAHIVLQIEETLLILPHVN